MAKARRQIGKLIRNERKAELIGNKTQKSVLIESEWTLRIDTPCKQSDLLTYKSGL